MIHAEDMLTLTCVKIRILSAKGCRQLLISVNTCKQVCAEEAEKNNVLMQSFNPKYIKTAQRSEEESFRLNNLFRVLQPNYCTKYLCKTVNLLTAPKLLQPKQNTCWPTFLSLQP